MAKRLQWHSTTSDVELTPIFLELMCYTDRYELNFHFWPEQTTVYIEKDGVELTSYGGTAEFALTEALQYLQRINRA